MSEKENFEFWGLSLSLKPPITNIDQKLSISKRNPQFFPDEESPKKKPNNKSLLMKMTRINTLQSTISKPPIVIDLDEVEIKGKAGSSNSTLSSSVTAKTIGGSGGDRGINNHIEGGRGGGSGGKRERKKLRLTKEQNMVFEHAFKEHSTLNTKQKMALARQVNLRPRQVEVWFQNRRARTKLKQTEVDCDYLRRFCKNLTEENKKLQKEVQELRALKLSPEQANHPPTTLTLCSSCKSVSFSSSSTTTKTPAVEMERCPVGVFPFNPKKLSLTINNNIMLETRLLHL